MLLRGGELGHADTKRNRNKIETETETETETKVSKCYSRRCIPVASCAITALAGAPSRGRPSPAPFWGRCCCRPSPPTRRRNSLFARVVSHRAKAVALHPGSGIEGNGRALNLPRPACGTFAHAGKRPCAHAHSESVKTLKMCGRPDGMTQTRRPRVRPRACQPSSAGAVRPTESLGAEIKFGHAPSTAFEQIVFRVLIL